ncbi:FACT complex subunit Spt16 like protein [Aduncisulcus paluster]|uniref:FACT complex subunit n=1 Tax=Aduncisulcus paluster TaxID=2918883 RepID=A0ABQ5K931_9EUKA|nr:FACT complex subunit Spt16 like protein [Aduncisulcus paluster]
MVRRATRLTKIHEQDEKRKERMEQQFELGQKMHQSLIERLQSGDQQLQEGKKRKEIETSYTSIEEFPEGTNSDRVRVCSKDKTVLFPLFGRPVPVHCSNITSVSCSVAGAISTLRVNLDIPKQNTTDPIRPEFVGLSFIKELTFQSADPKAFVLIEKKIREWKRQRTQRESDRKKRAVIISQGSLVKFPTATAPKLRQVKIYLPGRTKGNENGQLIAHANGFRFVSTKGNTFDLLYKTIRYAIFQPAWKSETKVILHFHLYGPISAVMKGTTSRGSIPTAQDVQIYAQVDSLSSVASSSRRSYKEEMQEEVRMRREIKKRVRDFVQFITRVREHLKKREEDGKDDRFKFQAPKEKFGFKGSSGRLFYPAAHCLVSLTKLPHVVVPWDDVEFVVFERLVMRLSSFDLTFVFKDLSQEPYQIRAVPFEYLEQLQDFFNNFEIKYFTSTTSIGWAMIAKKLLKDEKSYRDFLLEEGGWPALFGERVLDEDEVEEEEPEEEVFKEYSDEGSEFVDEEDSDEFVDEDELEKEMEERKAEKKRREQADDESSEEETEEEDWEEQQRRAKLEDAKKMRAQERGQPFSDGGQLRRKKHRFL